MSLNRSSSCRKNSSVTQEADETSLQDEWNNEVARRIEELDSGNAKTVLWEEVRRRISPKLQTLQQN
jgi:putative addiction module component (TIGR02574 family)